MFITDQIVLLDLPKTASTHVRRLLKKLEGGQARGVHVRAPRELRQSSRQFWGTVRSPWDWYVSLWAYGCDGKGTLYNALTTESGWWRSRGWKKGPSTVSKSLLHRPGDRRAAWLEAYSDVNSPRCFAQWLRMVHRPESIWDLGEGYAASGLSDRLGLMSWRFLNIYCTEVFSESGVPGTSEGLGRLLADSCYVDQFIRTEHLERDVVKAFAAQGRTLSPEEMTVMSSTGRSNTSSRRRDTGYFYTPSDVSLVAERDRFIIDQFNYAPPKPGGDAPA